MACRDNAYLGQCRGAAGSRFRILFVCFLLVRCAVVCAAFAFGVVVAVVKIIMMILIIVMTVTITMILTITIRKEKKKKTRQFFKSLLLLTYHYENYYCHHCYYS